MPGELSPTIEKYSDSQEPAPYPAEWLPPVDTLSGDFRYLLEGGQDKKVRVSLAIEYVDYLRDRIQPTSYSIEGIDYAQGQIMSRLFLDSIDLTARHQRYHSESKRKGRRSPDTFEDLKKLLATKRDMKINIMDYARINPDKSNGVLFNNLWSMMNHTRRLLYSDDITTEKSKIANAKELLGLLAENKVVLALQENQWPSADHSTVEQDSGGADVVIPIDGKKHSAVLLQVKSQDVEGGAFQIHPNHKAHKVIVPMNVRANDPFMLNPYDTQALNEFIYNAHRTQLPLAA